MSERFINEEYMVEESEANKRFAKGERREDYADAWKATGRVVLIGLPGSGKQALADQLALQTGLQPLVPGDADQAVAALAGDPALIVLDDRLVEDPAVQPHIHGSGKVFYLMADTRTLADRLVERGERDDSEATWRELSSRLATMEPVFYSVLHFIIQAAATPQEMVEDAMGKIAL